MPIELNCRFCGIADGKQSFGISDTPFLENENFLAIASIGALVEGWSLIVPKTHSVSLRNTYGTAAFNEFSSEVIRRVISKYGKVVLFEHGSNHEGSLTSCGTDHSHLHVVPLPFSLSEDLVKSDLSWQKIESSDIAKVAFGREYLFYSDNQINGIHNGLIHFLNEPISQFFRKLIANKLGKSATSDYKKFLYLENAENTHLSLSEDLI